MATQPPKPLTPAYISYKSFIRFINDLRDGVIPSRIDRSILGSMSGGAQSSLIGALEFLGLIDADGKPQPSLEALATLSGPQYAAKFKEVLAASYPFLLDQMDLTRATGSQVHEAFRKQNVQGSTAIKAIAFFLAAAKDAGIEMGKHVKTPSVVRTPKRNSQSGRGRPLTDEDDDNEDDERTGGMSFDPDVHPALAGILMQLPPSGEPLSSKDRKRFMNAFEAVLTLIYPNEDEEAG